MTLKQCPIMRQRRNQDIQLQCLRNDNHRGICKFPIDTIHSDTHWKISELDEKGKIPIAKKCKDCGKLYKHIKKHYKMWKGQCKK